MGCSSSKPLASHTHSGDSAVTTTISQNNNNNSVNNDSSTSRRQSSGPLTDKEIQMRIESATEFKTVTIGGITLKYAWVSQRGYYPDNANKENQDSYSIIPNFNSKKNSFQHNETSTNQAFFGVYDGHGKEGHSCARFIRDKLPVNILSKLEDINNITHKYIKQALTIAHFNTNDMLHADKSIDVTQSGTTSITILFRGSTMYVSNVGDSRAIIGSLNTEGRIVAKPMSSDHTPYRKDERERVKRHGARVLSMDQIEGLEPVHENWGDVNLGEDIDEGGDPPRVWSRHGNYPGTAFTRSFGDFYAKELGVSAEAEIFIRDITKQDKYIIIASDGVFEFLTNQMVIDIAATFTDPLEACNAIVNTAYNMWLQYEVRTDDITIIALFIDDFKAVAMSTDKVVNSDMFPSPTDQYSSSNESNRISSNTAGLAPETREQRPIRRSLSREKRKEIIHVQSEDAVNGSGPGTANTHVESFDVIIPKSQEEKKAILETIKNNFLFQHLNSAQRQKVIDVMQPVLVSPGDWVIRQGDHGDRFYVIENGLFEVRVLSKDQDFTDDPSGGSVVHIYSSGGDQHQSFGDLSLMYGKPRAASVIAISSGKLWALDRQVFKKVIVRTINARRDMIRTLKKVELLKCLNYQQMQRLTDLLVEETFPSNHYVIRQGEIGENFYLIVNGRCDCTINKSKQHKINVKLGGEAYKQHQNHSISDISLDVSSGYEYSYSNKMSHSNSSTDVENDDCDDVDQEIEDDDLEETLLMELSDNDYFGEKALLTSNPRAANVITRTVTTVLYINKSAFEEVLGPLANIIDEDRRKREERANKLAYDRQYQLKPYHLSDIHIVGKISDDPASPLLLGYFHVPDSVPALKSTVPVSSVKSNRGFTSVVTAELMPAINETEIYHNGNSDSTKYEKSRSISSDSIGGLTIDATGKVKGFGVEPGGVVPNITIRSFVLSEVDRTSLNGSVITSIEAARTVTIGCNYSMLGQSQGPQDSSGEVSSHKYDQNVIPVLSAAKSNDNLQLSGLSARPSSVETSMTVTTGSSRHSSVNLPHPYKTAFLPRLLNIIQDKNAYHLVYNTCVVSDLSTMIVSASQNYSHARQNPREPSYENGAKASAASRKDPLPIHQDVVTYISTCIITALEVIHSLGIIYRGIQPESIYIDHLGRMLLMDYQVSKVGVIGGKTYTICGCADYLSPEQISQRGHNSSVDLWALGCLLYELAVGVHPFSHGCQNEVEIYSKISSYGTKSFPSLAFPEYISVEMKSLINSLLVASPVSRLGVTKGGFDTLRQHPLFKNVNWNLNKLEEVVSPLAPLARLECTAIIQEGIEPSFYEIFSLEYNVESGWDKDVNIDIE